MNERKDDNIRKLIKIITLMLMLTLGIDKVKANTYQDNFLKTYDKVEGVYVTKLGQKKYYDYMYIIVRASDKQFVYCIEPGMSINENALYNGYINNYLSLSKLTPEQWDRIQKLAYYGYGYAGNGIDHSAKKWYAVTQYMIWQTAPNGYEIFFTDRLQGNKINLYADEMAEMERILSEHSIKPAFSNVTSEMNIGNTQVLTDVNNVLSMYDIKTSNNNVSVSKSGNNLYITANSNGSTEIILSKNSNKYKTPPIIFTAENTQRVLQAGNIDPLTMYLNINVKGAKVKVYKEDKETITPQGLATLKGAKYNLLDSNKNIITTLTMDSNGFAESDYILKPNTTYYLKEVSASNGYLVDPNEYSFSVGNNETEVVVKVKEQVIKGRVKVLKHDSETNSCKSSGMGSLVGAIYEVFDHNNKLVDTLTIGNDCSAITKLLPYGRYSIKEKKAGTGYYIDSKTYTATIDENNEVITITSKEDIIKGRIKLNKIDSETKTCKPLGQASLIGAKFVIIDYNNNIVDRLTIGTDCTAISKYLPYGRYKIYEESASLGYYINTEVFTEFVSEKVDYSIVVEEEVIKNYINILKQYDYVDGNSTFLNAEANITFDIFYPDGTKYGSVTTDKNGMATIELPFGYWKFSQVNTTTGFEKIYDFHITVDENSEKEHYYNILNNKLSAYLQVIKKDKETGNVIALPNMKFKILNTDTNKYVTQFVGGKVLDTFYTDNDGKFVTYLKLEAGNYKLVEIETVGDYLINKDGLEFSIGEDTEYHYTTYGAFVLVEFENQPIQAQVEIYKKGEEFVAIDGKFKYEEVVLDGIVFELYADEDIKSSDGNYIYYNKGDLVETLTTDNFGYAISSKIPLGKYVLIEKNTKDNYVLDTKKYHFELSKKDNKTLIVYKTFDLLNYLKKSTFEFTKTDLVDGTPIPNVLINLFTENDELIFSGKTSDDGKIVIPELSVGKYYIIEVEQATSYILNEEKIYFEIKEDGKVVKATMTNEKITGDLELSKIDFNTKELIGGATIVIENELGEIVFEGTTESNKKLIVSNLKYGKYKLYEKNAPESYVLNKEDLEFEIDEKDEVIKLKLENKKIKSKVIIYKVDNEGNYLSGVVIGIYDNEFNLINTLTTSDLGSIELELEYGKYYYKELSTLETHILDDEFKEFEIKEDNKVLEFNLINQLKEIEVPKTSVSDMKYINIISIIGIVLGLGFITYDKIRKK